MADRLRNLLYPMVIVAIVGSLWAYARARALQDELTPGILPANDPGLIDRAMAADTDAGGEADDALVAVDPVQ